MSIEVVLEHSELLLQIICRPEQCVVQKFAPDRPNQSLYKRMRHRNVRHRFDFLDIEDTEIGLPPMESIQRIMVGTKICRHWLGVNGSIEHPAQCDSIDNAAVNSKTDDPSRKLIHDDQNPVRS